MNPGYLSDILILIALILLVSGWKKELCGNIPSRTLFFFIIVWIPCSFIEVEWPGPGKVNLCIVLILLLCIYGLFRATPIAIKRVNLLAMGLVLAVFYLLMGQLFVLDPLLIIYRAKIDVCITLSAVALFLFRNPFRQITAISIGMLIGDVWHGFFMQRQPDFTLGGPVFQDEWWLTVFSARGLSLAALYSLQGWKRALLRIGDIKREWRK